ncbi:MAG TPA: hypothetical protein VE889_08830, partial [Actinomycetota bacterium]|nr:hypothetical protein [Actinomycetota bacterium]
VSRTARNGWFSIDFADLDAASATLIVGTRSGETLHRESSPPASPMRVDGFEGPGYYLLLWRNEDGMVFSAHGEPLPAGESAAG